MLARVDKAIVEAYYNQGIHTDRTAGSEEDLVDASRRLMEIIGTLHSDNGEGYAHGLMDVIANLTPISVKDRQYVLQEVVEDVLILLREGN